MFQKFRDVSDNELVFMYKKTQQDDLELEIISRYQKHARLLAGILYSKYKFLYQVEFDDVYAILLESLITSIKTYSDENVTFYNYWKVAATNDVNTYVAKFSLMSNNFVLSKDAIAEDGVYASYLRHSPEELSDDYLSSFDLDEILKNPKNKFNQSDVDIFNLFMAGYSYIELCQLTGLTYNRIRYRISDVKKKLANILFNR